MKKQRFGSFLSSFRLRYNLTESEVAHFHPLKQRYDLTRLDIQAIEHQKLKHERLEFILEDIIEGMQNFEQDLPNDKKYLNSHNIEDVKKAAANYASAKPAFSRQIVGVPKEEVFDSLQKVINVKYLYNQLGIAPEDEPKNLGRLLKAIRQYLGYSQRSMMDDKGDKHSVTYHKMEKNKPHNPSHEFAESLVSFITKKMQTRTFQDLIEAAGSHSTAVGVATNLRSENCFDYEVLSHNKDFSRVNHISGCRGVIHIPANQNRFDPLSYFVKTYKLNLQNIIEKSGGPTNYETYMAQKALRDTFSKMRSRYPGVKFSKDFYSNTEDTDKPAVM